jgi:orotidine-5'-phosphate decarboxylase
MMSLTARDRLCLALDVDDIEAARDLVATLSDYVGIFKIGAHLFSKEGPAVIQIVKDFDRKVFLDLKYHDIPNTVANAARMVTQLGVSFFDIHALGGQVMMRAAAQAVKEEALSLEIPPPTLLAVTVLTSIDDTTLQREIKISVPLIDYVVHLARLAQDSGLQGVIASPSEVGVIRQACGQDLAIMTPGIRLLESATDDQKRVLTPSGAIQAGATYIVVGRPIYNAPSPQEAAKDILQEIERGLSQRDQTLFQSPN